LRRVFRLETHVVEAIELALPRSVIAVADFPQNRDLLADNLVAWPLPDADGIKLLLKRTQSQAEQQTVPTHVPQRVEHHREQDRMPVWDQGTEAQFDFRGCGSERRQDDEWVDESIVRTFHSMGVKYQMVPHPNGIKTHLLSSAGSPDDPVSIGFRAEMRQKQTIFCSHDPDSSFTPGWPVGRSPARLSLSHSQKRIALAPACEQAG